MLPPKELAIKYELIPKKSLGQNFLFDLNITRKIVNSCPALSDLNIIEIGPGPGGLTTAIAESNPKSLHVIEYDDRASKALEAEFDNIKIHKQDALQTNLQDITTKPCAVLANLPYNISTKLLTNWLEYANHFEFLALMFQKEVAERIVAEKDSKKYGRLSVMCDFLCDAEILFDIPPEAFHPAPKVTSSVVLIRPLAKPRYAADYKKLETVVKAAFSQRRKMIKAPLKQIFDDPEKALAEANINPKSRAENLTAEDFCNLANLL